jgi:DNA-binding NtrC family response regulator
MDGSSRPATQILTLADGTAVQVLQKASLSVVKGADKGRSISISGDVVVCGADSSCDLVLTDPAVSSNHFEIRATPLGFMIKDLSSTNGTFVEGVRLGSCFVDSNTQIRLGRTKIRLSPSREKVEIPLSNRERFGRLLGSSVAMRRVFAVLERVSPTDATFLIEGESGTGKELVAESVHKTSPRAEGPLVAVDCGAIPENLVESELFGHERGAFTGAERTRAGFFEAASGGTILLDEIGELPASVQPKLLRVLETREIKKVGSSVSVPVDVRVVAATNRDLAKEVEAGRFREDLYYRLAVLRLEMPPLRERREDIPTLVEHFVSRFADGVDAEQALSADTMSMLKQHDWPGNVRELRNVVERLLVLPELGAAAIRSSSGAAADSSGGASAEMDALLGLPFHEARTRWTEHFEKTYLEAKLKASAGVVLRAAEQAEIPRQTFHRLMRKHGL